MALPDTLVAERHRDLAGRRGQPWRRRAIVALVAAIPLLAVLNVFGQRPVTKTAASPAASLELYVPERLRSGLIYEARFHVRATQTLQHAAIVLSPGWTEGTTVNTIEPSPESETSADGNLRFDLGKIDAGRSYLLFIQLQVNPTNVGRRSTDVALYDGSTRILTIHRTVTIFP
jgi:hypothetical protein